MEIISKQIRENARSSLKGNWILMVFFTLLYNNLGLIIFSIGFIYLEAYFKVSMGVLYNKLIEFKEIEEDKLLLDE